jgi:hypothetical protein
LRPRQGDQAIIPATCFASISGATSNIAGAERLTRDIAHTEKEIGYYLERLDIIDETVAQGFEDQPLHREGFKTAIASLQACLPSTDGQPSA